MDLSIRVGALQDSQLVAQRVDWQQLNFVASPAYLDAHGTPGRVDDLSGHATIVFRMPSSGRARPGGRRRASRPLGTRAQGRPCGAPAATAIAAHAERPRSSGRARSRALCRRGARHATAKRLL